MRKSVEEMTGEACREVGVLLAVFAMLDRIIAGHITVAWTITVALVSGVAFLLGCIIERVRTDE
jgi:hypothetical protein